MTVVRDLLDSLRGRRWAHLCAANLRILLGFAFLPAGLKKVLGQPFTDPANTGAFHEFLHAFHATGFFYHFVGASQLVIATLLMTQRFALLGAVMALPVFTAITVFCWSTSGVFTAVMVTLMLAGTIGLLAWDYRALAPLVGVPVTAPPPSPDPPLIDRRLWERCGATILLLYLASCALDGGVYRPKGADPGNPAFYVLPLVALVPVVTYLIERRRRR